jgi:cell shape-determining protein MreC
MPLSVKTELPLKDDFSQKERQYQNYIIDLEEEVRQRNETIRQLSGLRTRLRGLEGAKLVPADIITSSAEGPRNELIINRGSEDELIGTITELAGRTARVRLLSDVSSASHVNIRGLGINMLMQGNGDGTARIKLVPVKHKIKTGDTVLVQKKPGYLDIAMVAGVVQQCKRDNKNASLWDITVRPVCDVAKLNSVAVIVMNPATPPPAP